MRNYATIRSTFWKRGSGRRLRGDHEAQTLALYLMTCSEGTISGIFYLAPATIAHETGIEAECLQDAIERVSEIAIFDKEEDLWFVPNSAREQIGKTLKANDKRRANLVSNLEQFKDHRFLASFYELYSECYSLEIPPTSTKPLASPLEGASETSEGASYRQEAPSTVQSSLSLNRKDTSTGESETTCPHDLDLAPAQKANMQMSGVPLWAIERLVIEHRGAMLGKTSKLMGLDQWRVYLYKCVKGQWDDPKRKPKKDQVEANPWDN